MSEDIGNLEDVNDMLTSVKTLVLMALMLS